MELSKARPNQALTLADKLSQLSAQEHKQSEIVSLLNRLGIRRQARLSTEDYLVFAQDLEKYHLDDIAQGLATCGLAKRSEGDTAFPDMGTMLEFIKPFIRKRNAEADAADRQRERDEFEQHKREHPEEYIVSPEEQAEIDRMNAKFMQRSTFPNATTSFKRHIEATETRCPHCDKSLPLPKNMRMWTADQVLEFGAQLKEIERLAEANRAHAAEVLAEVVA